MSDSRPIVTPELPADAQGGCSSPSHCSAFRPHPGSLWLVVVECRYNVIAVCVSGKGFYIPGQEPCWHFDHVQKWIKEIIPPAVDGAEPASMPNE